MANLMQRPRQGQTYLLNEIFNLYTIMRQGPYLCIKLEDADGVVRDAYIQDTHVTEEEMLSVPGFKDTQWTFVQETNEYAPVFNYATSNQRPITDFVDYKKSIRDYVYDPLFYFWVTLKGFPCAQE